MSKTVASSVAFSAIIDSVFNPTLECYVLNILQLPEELRAKSIKEITLGLSLVLKELAKYIRKDTKVKNILDKFPKTPIQKVESKKLIGGARDCITRKIIELKEVNDSFQSANENVKRLIQIGASQSDITQAQYILSGIEKEISEEAVRQCKSSIMPTIISGTASILSQSYTLGLSALAAYGTYRLSGVPTKIVVESTAIGGNTVGSVVGSVASAAQGTMNILGSLGGMVGIQSSPFTFAEGIGADYGKKAADAVLDSIKDLGEEDVKVSFAIFIFIALLLLLLTFSYIGRAGNKLLEIVEKREISVTVTPLSLQLGIIAPGITQIQQTLASDTFRSLLNISAKRDFSAASLTTAPRKALENTRRTVPTAPTVPAAPTITGPVFEVIEETTNIPPISNRVSNIIAAAPVAAPKPAAAPKPTAAPVAAPAAAPVAVPVAVPVAAPAAAPVAAPAAAPVAAPAAAPVAAPKPAAAPLDLLSSIKQGIPLKSTVVSAAAPKPAAIPLNLLSSIKRGIPLKSTVVSAAAPKPTASIQTPLGTIPARMLAIRKATAPASRQNNSNNNWNGGGKNNNKKKAKILAYDAMKEYAAINALKAWGFTPEMLKNYQAQYDLTMPVETSPLTIPSAAEVSAAPALPAVKLSTQNYLKKMMNTRRKAMYPNNKGGSRSHSRSHSRTTRRNRN